MATKGFKESLRREIRQLTSRKMYFFGMIVAPLLVLVFLVSLMWPGLPERVPTAVVDLDHSSMSRSVTRSLNALNVISIDHTAESYDQALEQIRRGETFGFFVIPANFEKDALSGRTPTLEYFSNLTYFIPGTFAFKGFKTVAVGTASGVVREVLISTGIDPENIAGLLQPVSIGTFPLNNPWLNYSYYLTPSFSMALLALMIMIMTTFSITMEIKNGTSPQWLAAGDGSIFMAVTAKLLPQTVIFFIVALFELWVMFDVAHVPLNGSLGWMIAATFLLVTACQGFALFVCCLFPNPRLAFSTCCLFGILCFSFTGFSFPVTSMYGAIGVFSWAAPIRYWFLIYINEALDGVALYYSRYYFIALIIFPLLSPILLRRLRKACVKPIYVP